MRLRGADGGRRGQVNSSERRTWPEGTQLSCEIVTSCTRCSFRRLRVVSDCKSDPGNVSLESGQAWPDISRSPHASTRSAMTSRRAAMSIRWRAHEGGSGSASMLVRQRSALPSEVTIQPLTLELVDGLRIVHNEGFGNKYCCLCCPVADTDGRMRNLLETPERLARAAWRWTRPARRWATCSWRSTRCRTRTACTRPSRARRHRADWRRGRRARQGRRQEAAAVGGGSGEGERARNKMLSLAVIDGNPARRLYERVGFGEGARRLRVVHRRRVGCFLSAVRTAWQSALGLRGYGEAALAFMV